MPEPNYTSGDDYIVEFLGYRFSFNGLRLRAARRRGCGEARAARGERARRRRDGRPRRAGRASGRSSRRAAALGRYLVRHWERISLVDGESLVYWLRKLIFRGAWLDHRVKEGLLEVVWDDGDRRVRLPRPERRPRAARARADADHGTTSSSGAESLARGCGAAYLATLLAVDTQATHAQQLGLGVADLARPRGGARARSRPQRRAQVVASSRSRPSAR